jgi:hypothetical protein
MNEAAAGIGHNNPPNEDPAVVLHRKLAEDHVDLLQRREELLGTGAALPETINNDEDAGKVGDFVRMCDTLARNAEAARKAAKRPFDDAAKAVDGFFGRIKDPLEKLKKKIAPRQAVYLEQKAEAARRELLAEAEKLRAQAQRDADAAAAAAEEARKAQEARDAARREEEAAFRRANEERIASENAAKAAADARRAADEEATKAAEAEAAAAKKRAEEAAAEARKKSAAEAAATINANAATKVADAAETRLDRAVATERQASRLENHAEAAPAELARTRGDFGSVSTLQRKWTGELENRKTLDLEKLREHLPEAALEQAIRAFVAAGGRALRGARIFEDTTAQTR